MSALDSKESARNASQIDAAIASSSRSIEGLLHRVFYPTIATRTFDWPTRDQGSWVLDLDDQELASASAVVTGGTTLSAGQYLLRPDAGIDAGPPYDRIELNQGTSAAFETAGSAWQRSVSITGVWAGCPLTTDPAGTLASSATDSATTIAVSDSAAVGVGSILKIEDEYLIATAKSMVDTTQNLAGSLTAQSSADLVAVGSGAAFVAGEVIMVGSEKMLILEIAGNNLMVKRAWSGSTLAAHSNGDDVYAPRTVTVDRGALGSTAASHSSSTAVDTHHVPSLIGELCVAETVVTLARRSSGYARTIGNADQTRSASTRDINDIRAAAYAAHGRKGRHRAI